MSSNRNNQDKKPENLEECKQLFKFFKTIVSEECRQTPVSGGTYSTYNRFDDVNDIHGSVDSSYVHRDSSYPFDDHSKACKEASRMLINISSQCIDLISNKPKI